MLDFC